MRFSPYLSPSQLVCLPCLTSSLSVSSARVTSWFLFIHFTLGFDAAPLWCGVKYLQGFCFGLYWVGLWWVQTCHLYPLEAFSNRKHSLRGWAFSPLLSLYFYFGVEVRQWKLWTKKVERREMGEMKVKNMKSVRAERRKRQAKWAPSNRWHAAC